VRAPLLCISLPHQKRRSGSRLQTNADTFAINPGEHSAAKHTKHTKHTKLSSRICDGCVSKDFFGQRADVADLATSFYHFGRGWLRTSARRGIPHEHRGSRYWPRVHTYRVSDSPSGVCHLPIPFSECLDRQQDRCDGMCAFSEIRSLSVYDQPRRSKLFLL
jgi:hypothetical protein